MACREQPQLTATVVQTLIGDLVQEAVVDDQHHHHHHVKLSSDSETCQRLFDILGYQPCSESDETEDFVNDNEDNIEVIISSSQCTLYNSPKETEKYHRNWHNWLIDAVNDESSEDEFVRCANRRNLVVPKLHSVAVQTEQPRLRRQDQLMGEPLIPLAPCELTRQTIFIDALSSPGPHVVGRAPLADRFCYMLTDFASALYCSLAIMCCCTPNMFR
ncbi:uncharacterized protein Dwil_GK14855 [Drosophila willistoni]|uniref:Uncharacterized protein n=1 Tax=Drosophila willistoni TaxID=7260 RepID=B4MUG0_DROWI|nr:uncharacterized protein LOC6642097 [Drosophila willistoni]EDW76086.1 uncharacterized protein Dwil_GK14855 [Drosophila willistoni]